MHHFSITFLTQDILNEGIRLIANTFDKLYVRECFVVGCIQL